LPVAGSVLGCCYLFLSTLSGRQCLILVVSSLWPRIFSTGSPRHGERDPRFAASLSGPPGVFFFVISFPTLRAPPFFESTPVALGFRLGHRGKEKRPSELLGLFFLTSSGSSPHLFPFNSFQLAQLCWNRFRGARLFRELLLGFLGSPYFLASPTRALFSHSSSISLQ